MCVCVWRLSPHTWLASIIRKHRLLAAIQAGPEPLHHPRTPMINRSARASCSG